MEYHGDEDMQHGPAVEPSDDSAHDSLESDTMEHVRCWMCDGTGTWSSCDVKCRDCNGKGYVLHEPDTLTADLFPELSMYGHRFPVDA